MKKRFTFTVLWLYAEGGLMHEFFINGHIVMPFGMYIPDQIG